LIVTHLMVKVATSLAVEQAARKERSTPPVGLHPAHVRSEAKASLGARKQKEERKDETNRSKT